MSEKDLRYGILRLLKCYTLQVKEPIGLAIIAAHFPNDSYKSVKVQLCYLKSKAFIATRGTQGNYRYYITKRGLRWLNRLELYKLRQQVIEAFKEELDLYNSYT